DALRNFGEIDFDAGVGAGGGFASGASKTGGAHVLDACDGAGGKQFEAGFHNQFFHEWIADLNGAALLLGGFFGQILRGKSGAGEAIAAGSGTDVEDWIADALGGAAGDLFVAQHAEAEGIDQRIALISFIEINFARDGGNAEAISVMRNAGDDTGEKTADFGIGQFSEAKAV